MVFRTPCSARLGLLLQYNCQCDAATGDSIAVKNVGKDGVGAGVSPDLVFGPVDGVLLMLSLENGGAIEGTITQLETEWIST